MWRSRCRARPPTDTDRVACGGSAEPRGRGKRRVSERAAKWGTAVDRRASAHGPTVGHRVSHWASGRFSLCNSRRPLPGQLPARHHERIISPRGPVSGARPGGAGPDFGSDPYFVMISANPTGPDNPRRATEGTRSMIPVTFVRMSYKSYRDHGMGRLRTTHEACPRRETGQWPRSPLRRSNLHVIWARAHRSGTWHRAGGGDMLRMLWVRSWPDRGRWMRRGPGCVCS